MPNYDERQNTHADRHSYLMSEQRYKQLDQQIEAEMTRSEYDAISQLSDSKEDAIRDALRERNKEFEANRQLCKQNARDDFMVRLTRITAILVLIGLAWILYNTFL